MLGALYCGAGAHLRLGLKLHRAQWLGRSWLLQFMLLAVEQILALVAARLGLVDLFLACVASSLAAVQLCLPMREVDGPDEVRRVGGGTLVTEGRLVSLDRRLVDVGERLLAVGDALVEICHCLLLIDSPRCAAARRGLVVIGHLECLLLLD